MEDPFAGKASNGPESKNSGSIDWGQLKAEVIGKLDVRAEYAVLGVVFAAAAPDSKGRIACHAIARPDLSPSAFVSMISGVYHDSGGSGESLHLFAFAARHGGYGSWYDAAKSYAAKVGVTIGRVETRSGGRIVEETYFYRQPDGSIHYRVQRQILPNGKKIFPQNPTDATGKVSKWGAGCMDGIERLPFRLPELLASDPEEPIWIVEGEKNVLRLVEEGMIATTNDEGSKATERTWPKFLRWFQDRDCLVIPDNDPSGKQHALKVCAYLKPVARTVKLVELPDLPAKGDVVDWLAEGGSIEGLGQLAHAAPIWEPGTTEVVEVEPDLASRDATLADVRLSLSAEAWLWPGWIPGGVLTLLASEPGVGKTRFLMDLHRRLCHGLPWPDGAATPRFDRPLFLWVVADNHYQQMCELVEAFGIPSDQVVVNAMASDPFGGTSLQTTEEFADLEARIVRVNPVVVAIDTINNASDARIQDASDAKRQYKPLQEMATRRQANIVCATHLNVGGKVLGRRAIEKARVVINLEQPDPDGQEHRRKLWVSKSMALKPAHLGITMGAEGNEYDDSPPEKPEDGRVDGHKRGPIPVKLKECMDWLSTQINGLPVRVSAIRTKAETEGYSAKTLYAARDQLGIRETESELTGVNGRPYKLWSAPPDPGRF